MSEKPEPAATSGRPVFHIGFGKAGSTTLQRQIFPHLKGMAYFGMHRFAEGGDGMGDSSVSHSTFERLKEFYSLLFKSDGLTFNLERARENLSWISDQAAEDVPLFSHEAGLATIFSHPDVVVKAERLFKLFGRDLRILIIAREQTAILASQYRDHPFDPRNVIVGRPVSFATWVSGMENLRYFRYTDLLYYDRLAEIFDRLFGPENVLVLPLELMGQDPQVFAALLGKFMGVDPREISSRLGQEPLNVGHSGGVNRLRRLRRHLPTEFRFSRLLPKPLYGALIRRLTRGGRDKVIITPEVAKHIRDRYADSNQRLASRTGLDLSALGFSVPKNRPLEQTPD